MGTAFRQKHEFVKCPKCSQTFERTVRKGVAPKTLCHECIQRLYYRRKKK